MLKYLLIVLAVLLTLAVWYRAGANAAPLILFDEGRGRCFAAGGDALFQNRFVEDGNRMPASNPSRPG